MASDLIETVDIIYSKVREFYEIHNTMRCQFTVCITMIEKQGYQVSLTGSHCQCFRCQCSAPGVNVSGLLSSCIHFTPLWRAVAVLFTLSDGYA